MHRRLLKKNNGDSTYGKLQLNQAMSKSVNTAAVRLLQSTGIKESFSHLDQFGFWKVIPSDRTYTSALGGFRHGLSVLELTRAYAVFRNDGKRYSTCHQNITDFNGKINYQWDMKSKKIWRKETADKMKILVKGGSNEQDYALSLYE